MGRPKKDPLLDVESLRKVFNNKKIKITDEDYNLIKQSAEEYEFDGYSLVDSLLDNKFLIEKFKINFTQYIQAIKFCAYLVGGKEPAYKAYAKAFSDREFVQERINAPANSEEMKQITSAATRYSNTPYVKELIRLEANSIYLSYRKEFNDAINVLANEMQTAHFSKDRIAAADKLLTHIKPPETLKVDMGIEIKENTALQQFNDQLAMLVSSQRSHLESGNVTLKELGSMKVKNEEIIEAEYE